MSITTTETLEYVIVQCCQCGCHFGVIAEADRSNKEHKYTFYCPNGHPQSYTKSRAETLAERLTEAERLAHERQETISKLRKVVLDQSQVIDNLQKRKSRKAKKG